VWCSHRSCFSVTSIPSSHARTTSEPSKKGEGGKYWGQLHGVYVQILTGIRLDLPIVCIVLTLPSVRTPPTMLALRYCSLPILWSVANPKRNDIGIDALLRLKSSSSPFIACSPWTGLLFNILMQTSSACQSVGAPINPSFYYWADHDYSLECCILRRFTAMYICLVGCAISARCT